MNSLPRRQFLGTLATAAVAAPFLRPSLARAATGGLPASLKTGGFAIGAQAYTFNRFSVMEAIEFNARAGGKVIEFYPGQKFSKEEPTKKWDHTASDEDFTKVKEQLDKWKVTPVNYGVVGIPKDEAKARPIFEFAKKLGLYGVTTESTDAIDTIEKLVKEFDIRCCYHNHPKKPNDASYKVWDPNYILELTGKRDERIGSCADIGHWVRTGLKPVECLKILKGRVLSSHLKDRISQPGEDVVYGNGISDIPGVLDELHAQNFSGNISVEFEYNWDHSLPDVAQCIAFVRGYGRAKGWS